MMGTWVRISKLVVPTQETPSLSSCNSIRFPSFFSSLYVSIFFASFVEFSKISIFTLFSIICWLVLLLTLLPSSSLFQLLALFCFEDQYCLEKNVKNLQFFDFLFQQKNWCYLRLLWKLESARER